MNFNEGRKRRNFFNFPYDTKYNSSPDELETLGQKFNGLCPAKVIGLCKI